MNAFVKALTGQAMMINQKDILACLQFLTQLAPSALWGEAMHVAGLSSHIVNLLNAEEVSYLDGLINAQCFCSRSVELTNLTHRMRLFACEDRSG